MVRPREFDETDVVSRAMELFWETGFEATSLDALEERTGLSRSSLYNAFGDKIDLFCRALDAYTAGPCGELHRPFTERRGADALRGYLDGLAGFVRSRSVSRGCLMVNTGLEESSHRDVVRRVETHFRVLRQSLDRAYREGLEDGTLNPSLTPVEAADWLLTVVRGVMVGAASGEAVPALQRSLRVVQAHVGLREL